MVQNIGNGFTSTSNVPGRCFAYVSSGNKIEGGTRGERSGKGWITFCRLRNSRLVYDADRLYEEASWRYELAVAVGLEGVRNRAWNYAKARKVQFETV